MTDREAMIAEKKLGNGANALEAARMFNEEVMPVSLAWTNPAPEKEKAKAARA